MESKQKQKQNERLDIEDEDARRERLGVGKLFADFSESNSNSKADGPSVELPQPESRPFAVPESDVLARVRAFLPDFQASTAALVQRATEDPSSVNLENVRRGERAIAMDLGLGVYDAPGAAGRESEMDKMGLGPVVDSSEAPTGEVESSDSESETDSSSDGESGDDSPSGDEGMDTPATIAK